MNIHIVILYTICILIIFFIAYHYNKLKEITDIDKMIKTNFEETNRKFEEVNKAVTSLDINLEKANKIEKDVEELKKKHY
jgi:uncharacterized protein Yka (UPF0111/DUF47 family)|tara:strand:- start:2530 stop:2769 length:240 start_codon:yes stop_codon:yes gene_type:complete